MARDDRLLLAHGHPQMTPGERLARNLLLFIAVATIATGLTQALAPKFVLSFINGEATSTSAYFFRIIGMFMMLFGGVMWQALRARPEQPMPLFWAALQKLGAFAAVGIAVYCGLFSPLAWAVALFDLFTGVLALWYWNRIRGDA
jgi:hypothetical protein